MLSSLDEYADIITIALDHQLSHTKGGFVLDDFDVAIEFDKKMRASLQRYLRQKKQLSLQKMLLNVIRWLEHNGKDDAILSDLLKRSGLQRELSPLAYRGISNVRDLRIGSSGKGQESISYVAILLPTGSGVIYSARGNNVALAASWLDDNTIAISTGYQSEELERVNMVRMYDEVIKIVYTKTR